MNDLGLDGEIAHASSQVQDTYHTDGRKKSQPAREQSNAPVPKKSDDTLPYQSPAYSKPHRKDADNPHDLPTRWWYASTGFPLIAGTFGPMANAFSICALVENWRVEIPPDGTEEHGIDIPDPKWLIAVNAVSLTFALIANMSLLLNMAKRMPFRWAQPVTISGFWISSVLLTVLVGYAAHDFQAPGVEHQALSQAYYYGCWAAGLYQIISLMMCVTVYGAVTHRYSSDFNLTMAQRTLMLQTIAFLTYLLLGAVVYSHIEGWKFLDAVYWSDFTLLTVGIGGDMVPTTHLGMGLLFPFSIGGIVTLGLVVSSIRSMILDRGKRKLHARMTEKMRRRVVKQVDEICAKGEQARGRIAGMSNNLIRRLTLDPKDDPDDELNRRQAEFEAMRAVEELTSRRQKWMNLSVSTTAFAILWFIGALVFWQTEGRNQGWTYFTSLYFSWTSLLTIGYGDYVPLSNAGRPFFVFWSLLAVPSLTILISDMGDTIVKSIKEVTLWLGEVTILPSSEKSVRERLQYGISKAFRAKVSSAKGHQDSRSKPNSESDSEQAPFQQPGGIRLFKIPRKFKTEQQNEENSDRIARDFEEAETQDENEARYRGDHIAENGHHYRRILISEIRKLYSDMNLSLPKKYTYEEWAYYLKLLGEDESSSAFHRHAPVKSHGKKDDQSDGSGRNPGHEENSPNAPSEQERVTKWSWIGPTSPLMTRGDQSESEWLVSRLFERLEESLLSVHQEKEEAIIQSRNSVSETTRNESSASEQRHPRDTTKEADRCRSIPN